ncbi:MAG: hypothetical protein M3O09_06400 [Acidobacteriota bacterium]|nr:hypothetical protein [Acidobacteriota bacterium]
MKISPPEKQQGNSTHKPADTHERGTEQSPLFVEEIPSSQTRAKTDEERQDRNEKAANDRKLTFFNGCLVVVAFLQLLVYAYQASKLKETVESAEQQSRAMEDMVAVIQRGNRDITRAYLTVTVGGALFQEKREDQFDIKFEGQPALLNTGNTPARKVRIRTVAEILPVPAPSDFSYPLPKEQADSKYEGIVAAHQTYTLSAAVKDFVPDSEVSLIKEGSGKALHVWGLVVYEDIFGVEHKTQFGQILTWYPNGRVFGIYIRGQNDAD